MLVEDLPAFVEAVATQYDGSDAICHHHLTINKDNDQRWSAGYIHYDSGHIILAINGAETLEEVAVRLSGRLDRYTRMHPPKPRLLQKQQKQYTLGLTNITEGTTMPAAPENASSNDPKDAEGNAPGANQPLTHGQVLVGFNFNPGGDPRVTELKRLAAAQIDLLEELHNEQYPPVEGKYAGAYDVNLLQGHALRHVIDAQMACVKRATWPAPSATPADTSNGAGNTK